MLLDGDDKHSLWRLLCIPDQRSRQKNDMEKAPGTSHRAAVSGLDEDLFKLLTRIDPEGLPTKIWENRYCSSQVLQLSEYANCSWNSRTLTEACDWSHTLEGSFMRTVGI